MTPAEYHRKLIALNNEVADWLHGKRGDYYNPSFVLDLFERYATIRNYLRPTVPDLFDDLPVRDLPRVDPSSDFGGKDAIPRWQLEILQKDMRYCLHVWHVPQDVIAISPKVTKEGIFFRRTGL